MLCQSKCNWHYMDGIKHWPLGWNWWQCELWCPCRNNPSSEEKHTQSESSASALPSAPLAPSACQPCSVFKAKDGWHGGWQSGGPCCIFAGHNRSVIHGRSHAGALQRHKCRAGWGNCKGVSGEINRDFNLNKLLSQKPAKSLLKVLFKYLFWNCIVFSNLT